MQRVSALPGLLGSLTPGSHPLEGKSLYLDEVKSRSVSTLTDVVNRLGGKVESFLHKDVNIVVTGNRDALNDFPATAGKTAHQRESVNDAGQRPGTPRPLLCGSRGKALLEKAIRNNEKSRGAVLVSAARLWGVKVVYVEDFLKFVNRLTLELSRRKSKKCEKGSESSGLRVVRAGSLKADYVKVEDSSRRYRPLQAQSLSFPMLSYSRTYSPFENPAPAQPEKKKEEQLSKDNIRKNNNLVSSHEEKPSATPSPKLSRKKKSSGYCECCQINYKNQEEHLRSEVHQRFVQDVANYAVVDRLVAEMDAIFTDFKEPRADSLMMRLSGGDVASSAATEQPMESPAESSQTNQSLVTINDAKDSEPVPHTVLQPQEAQELGTAAANPFDVKNVVEKPNPETRAPSPLPEADACSVPELEPQIPQCCRAAEDLTHLEPLPDRVQPVRVTEDGDAHLVTPKNLKDNPSSSVSLIKESQESPSHPALSDCLSFPLLPLNLSTEVNSRKHSRFFTLSPKVSKRRRTSLKSDPTHQSSAVEFDPTANESDRRTIKSKMCESQSKQPGRERSSELDPPRLYPFYYDDVHHQPPFYDPPALIPSVPRPSPGSKPHPCSSSASLLSQSFSSVCIDPALVPEVTFSPASSESDWDSGLLSRLAPVGQLQPKQRQCELDLGLLLQSSCARMQDGGSYTSRLCSVLQPTPSSHSAFGDAAVYRSMETMDRWIVPRLGV